MCGAASKLIRHLARQNVDSCAARFKDLDAEPYPLVMAFFTHRIRRFDRIHSNFRKTKISATLCSRVARSRRDTRTNAADASRRPIATMDAFVGEYGSSDDGDGDDGGFVGPARAGSARQTADEATSDGEDAFVGPARPTAMTTRVNVDDRDGDDGDDGDDDDDGDDGDDDAWVAAIAARYGATTSETSETSEETKATQQRVNDLLIVARRRGVTPSALMFTSSTFRNPEFMETCARDGVSASDAFATGAKFAFDESPVEEEDFARALADEQKRVTEKYLAKRNGISFHSAGPQQPVVAPPPADEARQAAINSQIAKARVEARIALQKAGKLA